jgi:hypothetical protein
VREPAGAASSWFRGDRLDIVVPPFAGEQVAAASARPPNGQEGRIRCKRFNPWQIDKFEEDREKPKNLAKFGSDAGWFEICRRAISAPLSSESRFLPGAQALQAGEERDLA